MLALSGPLYALYELVIVLLALAKRKKKPAPDEPSV
jgi:Sec-independent protein secretion pathway component TatC